MTTASGQFVIDELCSDLKEIETLQKSEPTELEVAFDDYYREEFKDVPDIGKEIKEFAELPKDWLRQSMLLGFAKCHIQGKHVRKDPERAKGYLFLAEKSGNKQAAEVDPVVKIATR